MDHQTEFFHFVMNGRNDFIRWFDIQKKSPIKNDEAQKIWQLPTLPYCGTVPSAMRGLTALFGMGRGEHPRQNHHKNLEIPKNKFQIPIWDL